MRYRTMNIHRVERQDAYFATMIRKLRRLRLQPEATPEDMEPLHQEVLAFLAQALTSGSRYIADHARFAVETLAHEAFRRGGGSRPTWILSDWGHQWEVLRDIAQYALEKGFFIGEITPSLVAFVHTDPTYKACLLAFLNETGDPIPQKVEDIHNRVVEAGAELAKPVEEYLKDLRDLRMILPFPPRPSQENLLYGLTRWGENVTRVLREEDEEKFICILSDNGLSVLDFFSLFNLPTETGPNYTNTEEFGRRLAAFNPGNQMLSLPSVAENLLSLSRTVRMIVRAPDGADAYTLCPVGGLILKELMENPEYHNKRGYRLYVLDRFKEALPCFQEAARLAPENLAYQKNLGYCLLHLDRFEEALPYFKRAAELDKGHPWLLHPLGDCFAGLEQTDKALEHFRLALDLSHDSGEEIRLMMRSGILGKIFLLTGNTLDGIETLQAAFDRATQEGFLFVAKDCSRWIERAHFSPAPL